MRSFRLPRQCPQPPSPVSTPSAPRASESHQRPKLLYAAQTQESPSPHNRAQAKAICSFQFFGSWGVQPFIGVKSIFTKSDSFLADVFVPESRILRDEFRKHRHTLFRRKVDHFDSIFLKPIDAAAKINGFTHNNGSNSELTDQPAAIPARRKRCHHDFVPITFLASRSAKRIRLPVRRRIAFLHSTIVATAQEFSCVVEKRRADRNSALCESALRFFYRDLKQPLITNLVHLGIPRGVQCIFRLLLQGRFDFLSVLAGLGEDFRFVQGKEFLVTHNDAAANHHRFDVARFQSVGELRINIIDRNRVWLVERDENDVGPFFRLPASLFLFPCAAPLRLRWWPFRRQTWRRERADPSW